MAEFFYGFGNNYAGANLGNLDVCLASLQKFAPKARVIVLVDKSQRQYAEKLGERFPLHAILTQPVRASDIEPLLPGGRSSEDQKSSTEGAVIGVNKNATQE